MTGPRTFGVSIERKERYSYQITFDDPGMGAVHTDEPDPIGDGSGPNPTRLLGAAVGNCLAASLQFCLEKARLEVEEMRARVEGTVDRDENGRLRIMSVKVRLEPVLSGGSAERFRRCEGLFEDFCIVTQSVRRGLEVDVEVDPVFEGQADA